MPLTDEQQLAVDELGKNIIVSAGAGSGKTKVLSDRVFKHLYYDKWDIDEMLILTFTKAAAKEMKKRIRDKVVQNEGDVLSIEDRNKQLSKIDSAYISTFDAYALFLVKKYHSVLNIDKDVNLVDSNILSFKTNEFLDEIFENEYKNRNEDFIKLVNDFCIKNDNNLKEAVLSINQKLNLLYKRDEYLDAYIDKYYSVDNLNSLVDEYSKVLRLKIGKLKDLIDELSYEIDVDQIFPNINNLLSSSVYEDIKQFSNIVVGRLPKGLSDEAKDNKKKASELIKEIEDGTKYTRDILISDIENTKVYVAVLIRIVKQLNVCIDNYKKANNQYEFNDIFKMAISLVDKHEKIKEEIKNQYKEILVDEYQDTSDLQDIFISNIENNNVYMVGDIKQSIYQFRNANPELFKRKYEDYKKGIGGRAIDLTYNFRSRSEVLDNINVVFNKLMTTDIGGADYTMGHQMRAGNKMYDSLNKLSSYNMEVLSYPYDKENKKDYPFDGLSRAEVEAFIVAKDIEDKINSHYKISTFKDGEMVLKDVDYSDFSILIDRATDFDVYKQILNYRGIPTSIEQDEKMTDSFLIMVVESLFKILNHFTDEPSYEFRLAYSSLARSFICEMKDSEIYDVYQNDDYSRTELYQKLSKIYDNIHSKSINNILDEFIEEFDVYNRLNLIGDVSGNLVKIDRLFELGHNLSNLGYTYKEFGEYLENVNEDGNISFSISKENENAVKMTTIHKSKGLEYPICYFPGLYKQFNKDETKSRIIFDTKLGFIMPCMVEGRGLRDTVLKSIYKYNYDVLDVSEKIRLFYVALTRAREKMVLVTSLQDRSTDAKLIPSNRRMGIKCFKDMLDFICNDLLSLGYVKELDFNDYLNVFNSNYMIKDKDLFKFLEKKGEELEIENSVVISPIVVNADKYSKKLGLIDADTSKRLKYGNRLHNYLQLLDFNNPDYSLLEDEFIGPIKAFLNSDLMSCRSRAKIYKEYEFISNHFSFTRHGFIDLMMEYDDHIDIIDYKLKNIDDDKYREQLNGYRDYISSISDKRIDCYLYSLIDGAYRKIES